MGGDEPMAPVLQHGGAGLFEAVAKYSVHETYLSAFCNYGVVSDIEMIPVSMLPSVANNREIYLELKD